MKNAIMGSAMRESGKTTFAKNIFAAVIADIVNVRAILKKILCTWP